MASPSWVWFLLLTERGALCTSRILQRQPAFLFPATLLFKPVLSRLSVEPPLGLSFRTHCLLGSQVTRGAWAGLTVSGGPPSRTYLPRKCSPCEETLSASPLQKLLGFLQVTTKVLLIPTPGAGACPPALRGSLSGVLWGLPSPDWLVESCPRDPVALAPKCRGPGLLRAREGHGEGGLRDSSASRAWAGGGAWLGGGAVRSWPGLGLRSPCRACGCPPATVVSSEEAGSRPIFYFRKFTGRGASAQSHWRCVLGFFLVFRFFLNKSIFLGAITQKGPVGCVCVS